MTSSNVNINADKSHKQQENLKLVQLFEPPQALDKSEFDYKPYELNQTFLRTYTQLYDAFLDQQKQRSYQLLQILETFSLTLLTDLFQKLDISEIRYQYQPFPSELKDQLLRFKLEEIDNGSLSGFEDDDFSHHNNNHNNNHNRSLGSIDGGMSIGYTSGVGGQGVNNQKSKNMAVGLKGFRKDKVLTKKQLKKMIKEKNMQVKEMKEEVELSKVTVNEMRLNCQKDITHLRELIFKREKLGDQFKEIDVKYFDITEGLPEQYAQILNTKIFDMKQGYQKILKEFAVSNEQLSKQVALLDLINKDGIKFKQMNAEHLISRLNLIEKLPTTIWETIHKYYGDDFFLQNIEDEYGISPNSYDTLLTQMQAQLKAFESQTQQKLTDLKDHYQTQLYYMRKDLQSKTEENGRLNRQIFLVIDKTKKDIETQQEELFRQKEINLFNRYDNEKQELYDRIRELETACEDFEKSRLKIMEKAFFTKWIFFTQMHKIKGTQGETKQMLAERTEQMLIEREMKLQDFKKIAMEHQGFKEENFKLQNDISYMKYELSVLTNKNNILEQNGNQLAEQIEYLQNEILQMKRQHERTHLENISMKQNKSEQEAFVKNLEDQIAMLKQKVERGQMDNGKVTQKSALRMVQNNIFKQLNDLSNEANKNVEEMQKQNNKDVACLTVMSGLHKPFGMLNDRVNAPSQSKQTQVSNPFGKEAATQSEQAKAIEKSHESIQCDLLNLKDLQINQSQQQDSFFLTSNPLSNRNQQQSQNRISDQRTADGFSYPQSNVFSTRKYTPNEFQEGHNSPSYEMIQYNENHSSHQNNKDDLTESHNLNNQINHQNFEANDTIRSLQFISGGQNASNSRLVSATRKYQKQIQLQDSNQVLPIFDQRSFSQNEQVDEEGNLMMYNPESGKTFKIQYNKYLKSMNYQAKKAKNEFKSQFRIQDSNPDQNVYKRLWNDIGHRNEKQVAAQSFIQEQRLQQLDKVMKLINDTGNQPTSTIKEFKRSNSVSHKLDDALVLLQSLNTKDHPQIIQELPDDNKFIISEERKKRIKLHQQKLNLNQKQQLCKIVPYNLKIMSNILGKVYTEKFDKGIQVDDHSRDDQGYQKDKIEENYKILKRAKQKRIKHGIISSSYQTNHLGDNGNPNYGINNNNQKPMRRKINMSMNERRNVSSSGNILNNSSYNMYPNQATTPTELQINQMNLQQQRFSLLSPNSRDSSVQVQWKEQDPQIYDFNLNSPEVRYQQRMMIQKPPQSRDIHSAKKSKSRLTSSRKSLNSAYIGIPSQNQQQEQELLPIHSKESFVIQIMQRAKESQQSLKGKNKEKQIIKNNQQHLDLSLK